MYNNGIIMSYVRLEILFTLRSTYTVRIARVVPPAPLLAHRVVGLRTVPTVISILFVCLITDDVALPQHYSFIPSRWGTMAIMFSFRFLLLALLSTNGVILQIR
jgi:hypothetical protein